MRIFQMLAAIVVAFSLSGCLSTKDFFGTSDPCGQAELAYSAFLTLAATSDKVSPKARKAAAAGMSAVREQCSDGNVSKVTLAKAVRAYVAGLETWKKG